VLEYTLGIAGTAKNTGKTTTTNAILACLRQRGIAVFLTSIGYDGENLDNVTGLPKPKIPVEPGDIIATAARCLDAGTAQYERICETDICTPLGRVQLVRVTTPGLVVTAGPNKSSETRRLISLFREIGPGLILLDGALNRLAPMAEADGLVLATGAALTTDIPLLARDTGYIEQVLHLPCLTSSISLLAGAPSQICVFDPEAESVRQYPGASLFSLTEATQLASDLQPGDKLYIPGIIGEAAFGHLAACWIKRRLRGQLIFADPIKLLVAGKASYFCDLIDNLARVGMQTGVLRRLPLLAVTVNPFYPQYRMENDSYHPAYVDFHRLQVALRSEISTPVYNVVRQGAERIVDAILQQMPQ
jgi:hypothetical protein